MTGEQSTIRDVLPLPSQRTQRRLPYPWLERHIGAVGLGSPLLAAIGATIAGMQLQQLDVGKALSTYGLPWGACALLGVVIVWTYTVFIPRMFTEEESRRQVLLQISAEDRRAYLETTEGITRHLQQMDDKLSLLGQRVEGLISGEHPRARVTGAHPVIGDGEEPDRPRVRDPRARLRTPLAARPPTPPEPDDERTPPSSPAARGSHA